MPPPLKCPVCQEPQETPRTFARHLRSEHPNTCTTCLKKFSRRGSLLRHQRKNIKCAREKIRQQQTSDDDARHQCVQCPSSFTRPHDLRRHVRQLHALDKIQRLVCPLRCSPSTYKHADSLRKHMKLKHPTEPPLTSAQLTTTAHPKKKTRGVSVRSMRQGLYLSGSPPETQIPGTRLVHVRDLSGKIYL